MFPDESILLASLIDLRFTLSSCQIDVPAPSLQPAKPRGVQSYKDKWFTAICTVGVLFLTNGCVKLSCDGAVRSVRQFPHKLPHQNY